VRAKPATFLNARNHDQHEDCDPSTGKGTSGDFATGTETRMWSGWRKTRTTKPTVHIVSVAAPPRRREGRVHPHTTPCANHRSHPNNRSSARSPLSKDERYDYLYTPAEIEAFGETLKP
jgi:uncharacterized protein YecE (DUF72 family)